MAHTLGRLWALQIQIYGFLPISKTRLNLFFVLSLLDPFANYYYNKHSSIRKSTVLEYISSLSSFPSLLEVTSFFIFLHTGSLN